MLPSTGCLNCYETQMIRNREKGCLVVTSLISEQFLRELQSSEMKRSQLLSPPVSVVCERGCVFVLPRLISDASAMDSLELVRTEDSKDPAGHMRMWTVESAWVGRETARNRAPHWPTLFELVDGLTRASHNTARSAPTTTSTPARLDGRFASGGKFEIMSLLSERKPERR